MSAELGLKIALRFFLGGGAVALSAVIARSMGGRVGGIFAAFPAVYVSAVIAVGINSPKTAALAATLELSKGALVGMLANIFCACSAAWYIPKHGWKKGLVLALVVWAFLATLIYYVAFEMGWVN